MNNEMRPIIVLQRELEAKLQTLLEEFQRRQECRGVQIKYVAINQVDWHNGFNVKTNAEEQTLKSGPEVGYRISDVRITLVLP